MTVQPLHLPAHEQTPVVEDRHGDGRQPAVVEVAGGIHHEVLLLLSGNTHTHRQFSVLEGGGFGRVLET